MACINPMSNTPIPARKISRARRLTLLSETAEVPGWYPSFLKDRVFRVVFVLVLLAILAVGGAAIRPVITLGPGQHPSASLAEGRGTVAGQLSFLSSGQVQNHTNLLATMSRLLVAVQDASITPLSPTTDRRYWWYVGSIPQIHSTEPAYSHYTLLDHIRHLLVAEPTLAAHRLAGGLVVWLERNTSGLVEWSLAARGEDRLVREDLPA